MMPLELIYVPLLLALGVAVVTDLRCRRIPNWLTGPAILCGLGIHAIMNRLDGLIFGFEGAALGLGMSLVLYIFGWIGAGDVKLCAAVGSFLGPLQTLSATILIGVAGGVLAILMLGLQGGWRRAGLWIWNWTQTLCLTRSMQAAAPVNHATLKLPYAVAISIGTVWSYWWSPL